MTAGWIFFYIFKSANCPVFSLSGVTLLGLFDRSSLNLSKVIKTTNGRTNE